MSDKVELSSQEAVELLNSAFEPMGEVAMLAPIPVNRFLMAPNVHGGHPVIILGAAVVVQVQDKSHKTLATVHGAYAIPKNMAEDIIARFIDSYQISDSDLQAARVRNFGPEKPG